MNTNKRAREDQGTDDDHNILEWQRREAVLAAHEFLLKDARDSAERKARAARDLLQELHTIRFALILEGHKLGIGVLDGANPVRNAIVDELNEMREFRTKVAHVEAREEQWGLSKLEVERRTKL